MQLRKIKEEVKKVKVELLLNNHKMSSGLVEPFVKTNRKECFFIGRKKAEIESFF